MQSDTTDSDETLIPFPLYPASPFHIPILYAEQYVFSPLQLCKPQTALLVYVFRFSIIFYPFYFSIVDVRSSIFNVLKAFATAMSEIHGAFGTAMSEIHGGLYQRLLGSRRWRQRCWKIVLCGAVSMEWVELKRRTCRNKKVHLHQLCTTITIQELKGLKMGTIFHGQILVIYKTLVDQVHGIQLLRADLVDSRGNMTITLNVPHNLIAATEAKLVVGQGICITNFKVSPRTVYDHGDCPCILVLHEKSILEAIPPICTEYRFVPTTTINQLTSNQLTSTTAAFATGTVAGLVTAAKEIAGQYVLTIKDGLSQKTKPRCIFSSFQYISSNFQIHPTTNFETRSTNDAVSKSCPRQRTWVITHLQIHIHYSCHFKQGTCRPEQTTCLNNKGSFMVHKIYIINLTCLNNKGSFIVHKIYIKVKGMLTIADIHAEPFVTICNNCSLPADTFGTVFVDQLNCSTCRHLTTYRRSLQLNCIIQTEANVQYKCILKNSLLLELCPSLTGLTYEKYHI